MRKETVGPSQAVIRLSCFAGLGMGVILTLLCGVFSEELISCVIDSEGIRKYGTPLVRTLLLSGPVMGILFIYINTLQAIGAEAAQPVAEFFRKHSKKCTFYTLRFGCSFAAVNTIKPQLL